MEVVKTPLIRSSRCSTFVVKPCGSLSLIVIFSTPICIQNELKVKTRDSVLVNDEQGFALYLRFEHFRKL